MGKRRTTTTERWFFLWCLQHLASYQERQTERQKRQLQEAKELGLL